MLNPSLKFEIQLFLLGKQAVVVLLCENAHMPSDMIADPGIVMIFAHGVEDVWKLHICKKRLTVQKMSKYNVLKILQHKKTTVICESQQKAEKW